MQATYILKSSTIVGAAAYAGEEEKDICHEAEVAACPSQHSSLQLCLLSQHCSTTWWLNLSASALLPA